MVPRCKWDLRHWTAAVHYGLPRLAPAIWYHPACGGGEYLLFVVSRGLAHSQSACRRARWVLDPSGALSQCDAALYRGVPPAAVRVRRALERMADRALPDGGIPAGIAARPLTSPSGAAERPAIASLAERPTSRPTPRRTIAPAGLQMLRDMRSSLNRFSRAPGATPSAIDWAGCQSVSNDTQAIDCTRH